MKINLKNEEQINSAIATFEGKARVRTLGWEQLTDAVKNHRLLKMLPKVHQVGLKMHVTAGFGGRIPNSYNGKPWSTYATLERFPSGWFLIGGGRCASPAWDTEEVFNLSDEQKTIIVEQLRKQ